MVRSVTRASTLIAKNGDDIARSVRAEKIGVFIKLDQEVVEWFRSSGPGYQRKINEVLRRFVSAVKSDQQNDTFAKEPSVLERAQELFEKYYVQCFWHMKRDLIITEVDLPQIIKGLKMYGGRAGFLEASELCR